MSHVAPGTAKRSQWRRMAPWAGGATGIVALVWLFSRVDYARFMAVLADADLRFLALVPVSVLAEQWVRALKWRHMLYPIRVAGTAGLFGAIMAGYFASLVIPFGVSPVVRAWLLARRESLKTGTVLATVALDRLIDGVVFTGFIPVALVLVALPELADDIRAGLGWGGGLSLLVFVALLFAMSGYRLQAMREHGWLRWCADRLPRRFAEGASGVAQAFAEGIVWPRETWRRVSIVLASVVIKLIAATHFLWAGLAVGVLLPPGEYVFLLVFLGFLTILTHFARVAAGFTLGAIFALGLLGVTDESALAMVLIVQGASLGSVTVIGSIVLWRHGILLRDLKAAGGNDARRG